MIERNYETIDPTTGREVEAYPFAVEREVNSALESAARAFVDWSRVSPPERAKLLLRAAELLEKQAGELAEWMALEMGKLVGEGEAEANKCAWACRTRSRRLFYPATVLVDAPDDSPAATEELFGPVATLFRFENDEDAVMLANATDYGLGASLWTSDPERAERLIPRIESGAVFVNGMVKSDPRLPFGGVKNSGFGRDGMLEFVNRKTVWIA